jgi:hypothetical protein
MVFFGDFSKNRVEIYYSQYLNSYKVLHNGGQVVDFSYKMEAQSTYRKAC